MRRTVFRSFLVVVGWLHISVVTVPRGGVAEVPVWPFTGGRCLGGADSGAPSPKTSELIYRKSLFLNKSSSASNPVLCITVVSTVSSKIFRKKIFTRSASTHRDSCRACLTLFELHTVTMDSAHGIYCTVVLSYLADRRNWRLSWRREFVTRGLVVGWCLTVVLLDRGNRLFAWFVIYL